MTTEQKPKTVTKQRVLVETKIVVEPGWVCFGFSQFSPQEKRKALVAWAKQLMNSLRGCEGDCVEVESVDAEAVYEQQCSGCGREWEEVVDEDTGLTVCASCWAPMEVVR